MRNFEKGRWAAVPALGFTLSLVACFNSNESGKPTQSDSRTDIGDAYVQEAQALKRKPGIEYDHAVKQLQSKHGIVPLTDLPENPLDPRIAAGMAKKSNVGKPTALPKVATTFASGTYTVKRVFMEVKYLGVGDEIEWLTYGGSEGADPVMVLYRHGNQSPDFVTTGYVNPAAQNVNTIYAYNDDYSTLHPKISYTVPSGGAGYYAIMVFAYSNSSHGTVTLAKGYRPSGGSWTTTTEDISVTGHIVRYWGDYLPNGYLYANAHSGTGADPWAFWWNFGYMSGGSNDDSNGTVNSWAALSGDFPASASDHYLNCMIFTGWNSVGTADWRHGN